MARVEVIVPVRARLWQAKIVERLRAAGHQLGVTAIDTPTPWSAFATMVLDIGGTLLLRRAAPLWDAAAIPAAGLAAPELRLDLTGVAPASPIPTLRLAPSPAALLTTIAKGELPELTLTLDGKTVASAAPMIDDQATVVRGFQDVLARIITLTVATVGRWPTLEPVKAGAPLADHRFLPAFLGQSAPRGLRELWRRMFYRFAHWRVGFRFIDGPGVAATGKLGKGWFVLGDDGQRFYADPFPFEHQGRHYIFVEDYLHRDKRAAISVAMVDESGEASTPEPVIVEPYHLSYPQVFRHGGEIWMMPQGTSGDVSLYRATDFPHRWEKTPGIIAGEISDATLLERDGRLWLFATQRDGAGSTSDTLVVFSAKSLRGPWTPHRQNPILIDRRRARPGGAFVEIDGRLLLPIQDGTEGYGGGLGLAELIRLDDDVVEFGEPRQISPEGDFPYPKIHTLNRAGRLEVIDGIVAVRKF